MATLTQNLAALAAIKFPVVEGDPNHAGMHTLLHELVAQLKTALDGKVTQTDINASIAALVNGAPGALDTLKEISDQLAADEAGTAAILATQQQHTTKLGTIATGATANSTDAQLRDRSTHTGTQAISTVTGLQAALNSLGNTATTTLVLVHANSLGAGIGSSTGTADSPSDLAGNDYPAVLSRKLTAVSANFLVRNVSRGGWRTTQLRDYARIEIDPFWRPRAGFPGYAKVYYLPWEITNECNQEPKLTKEEAYANYWALCVEKFNQGFLVIAFTAIDRVGWPTADVDWINAQIRTEWSDYAHEICDVWARNLVRDNDGVHLPDASYEIVGSEAFEKIQYIETGFKRVNLLADTGQGVLVDTLLIAPQTANAVNGYVEVAYGRREQNTDYVIGFDDNAAITDFSAYDAGLQINAVGVRVYGLVTGSGSFTSCQFGDVVRLVYEKTRFVLLKNGVEVAAYPHSLTKSYHVRLKNAGGASNIPVIGAIGAYRFAL